jgi:hypothetical protein
VLNAKHTAYTRQAGVGGGLPTARFSATFPTIVQPSASNLSSQMIERFEENFSDSNNVSNSTEI